MNTSYKAIETEYLVWLDTLGYSKDVIRASRYAFIFSLNGWITGRYKVLHN
jgi:hypothetical protein